MNEIAEMVWRVGINDRKLVEESVSSFGATGISGACLVWKLVKCYMIPSSVTPPVTITVCEAFRRTRYTLE